MRVIAGSAKGMTLRSPSSSETRPISDRGKEALFSILFPRLAGATFLDLFAGTGGAGIEALSRGARRATFVELSAAIVGDLRFNLERTRLATRAEVIHGDAFDFLSGAPRPFEIVFVAPPQWLGLWVAALRRLDADPLWLAPDGIVVAQHDPKEAEEIVLENLEAYDSRTYGGVEFSFFKRAGT
jgi:16S rRNA (guanine966-N2)-methyltransferase